MSRRLDALLHALADPTRREIFERVTRTGPRTATSLADDVPVTRQAIAKHLEILAEAGLATSEKVGRETRWAATTTPLADARDWIDEIDRTWARRLDALAERAAARRTTRSDNPPPTEFNGP